MSAPFKAPRDRLVQQVRPAPQVLKVLLAPQVPLGLPAPPALLVPLAMTVTKVLLAPPVPLGLPDRLDPLVLPARAR